MKKNNNKAYLKPTTEIVYITECANILAGSGEISPTIDLDGRTNEDDAM
jgi:hypothetical protein